MKKRHMAKRCTGLFLAFALAASLVCATDLTALAASDTTTEETVAAAAETDETVTLSGGETITEGGTYSLAADAAGVITISTTDEVEITGNGAEYDDDLQMTSTPNETLYFSGAVAGIHLTLSDMYISDTSASVPLLDLTGEGNILTIEGTVVLDMNTGYNLNAAIHVGTGTSLTVNGTGILYLYKNTQGAGFGGNSGELNGEITFGDDSSSLTVFAKGTKQGALIGAGANASSTENMPGSVSFVEGVYNLISNSRGAVIGGSAGSGGASDGTTVYVGPKANININVDYSGAAVGGGGYDGGNDSSGGILYITGGSLRCYIDTNAAGNTTGWNGNSYTAGVNDAAITAQRLNGAGETVYRSSFDTTLLTELVGEEAESYEVYVDGELFYKGGLPEYGYVQEGLDKGEQLTITSTVSNWYKNGETNLYFYLTGEDHTVTVNGKEFTCTWDGEAQSYTYAAAEDTSGDSEQDELQIISQPTDVSGTVGSTAVFEVEATGSSLTYQWQYLNVDAVNWKDSGMNGADTAALTVSITEARDGQQYRCVVTDGEGNIVMSDAATLTVSSEVGFSIIQQPSDYIGLVGTTAVFTVEADGTGLTYRWQYQSANGSMWHDSGMTGADTAELSVPVTEARDGQQYRCIVTDENGNSVISEAAVLNLPSAGSIVITAQPTDVSGSVGDMAVFTVEADGTGLTYQWQYLNAGAVNWKDSGMTGADTATLSVLITEARDGQQYRCVITDEEGNMAVSDVVTISWT